MDRRLSLDFHIGPQPESVAGIRSGGRASYTPLAELGRLLEEELRSFEGRLEELGAPWTPGRVPRWTPE